MVVVGGGRSYATISCSLILFTACSPSDTLVASEEEHFSAGAQVAGHLVTTIRNAAGTTRELDRTPIATSAGQRGAIVDATVDGVQLRIPVVFSGSPITPGPSLLLSVKRTPEVDNSKVIENGRTHIIATTRAASGGPIREIRHSINGELAFVMTNVWRATAEAWILERSVHAQYKDGRVVGEMVIEVVDFSVTAASTTDLFLDRLNVAAAAAVNVVLPARAHAMGGCGSHALAVAATGWGAYLGCGGGVLLFTPVCGAAMLAHAAASWALADCMAQPT